ncbi:MAG: aldehyde dehydrogenase [Balneolaceae bacterium]
MNVKKLLNQQKTYFSSGATKSVEFRIHQLKTLKKILVEHENELNQAVHEDFNKSPFEMYATEIGVLHTEINYALKNLKKWAKPKRISSSLINFPSKNYSIPEPYGSVLIIAPWNYPLQLALLPLVGAIAAGNTAVIKPSEITSNTSAAISKILSKWFKEAYIAVVEGGVEVSQELLAQNFDYIFFTGSTRVGKIVMEAASKNLTPVTLELGGKSPCIVDSSADLKTSAKRLAWGKFMNGGQTCIAPDYLLIQENVKDEFLEHFKNSIRSFYDVNAKLSPDFPRIVNDFHFDRLSQFLKDGEIFFGGKSDPKQRYIEPTVLDNISLEDAVMQEEIFGPILPVLTFKDLPEAVDIVNSRPKPMALYLFTKNRKAEQMVLENCSFGGGAINDVILQIVNHKLPFGGVGKSGMGAYHGHKSFEIFSHYKSIVKKSFWFDFPVRYPPYKSKLKWIKRIIK